MVSTSFQVRVNYDLTLEQKYVYTSLHVTSMNFPNTQICRETQVLTMKLATFDSDLTESLISNKLDFAGWRNPTAIEAANFAIYCGEQPFDLHLGISSYFPAVVLDQAAEIHGSLYRIELRWKADGLAMFVTKDLNIWPKGTRFLIVQK